VIALNSREISVREYVFYVFFKIQKTRFLRFLEMTCQKT